MSDEPEPPSVETPIPGADTVRWCANCEADVDPKGKGNCPACGRFLRDNVAALVHGGRRMHLEPKHESRRAELRAKVWADLGGTVPPIIGEVAEDFVSACVLRDQLVEHLEAIGPLTQRGTRRAAMDLYLATSARIERLSAMLGSFRGEKGGTHAPSSYAASSLDRVPVSALHDAHALLSRQLNGETLTEGEAAVLAYLERALRGEIALPPDPAPAPPQLPEPADVALQARDPQPAPRAAKHDEPAPRPTCSYCGNGPCVGESDVLFATLHFADPKDVERRNKEATAIMLRQIGKPLPW